MTIDEKVKIAKHICGDLNCEIPEVEQNETDIELDNIPAVSELYK